MGIHGESRTITRTDWLYYQDYNSIYDPLSKTKKEYCVDQDGHTSDPRMQALLHRRWKHGAAIIGGLLAKGSTTKQNIIVSEPFEVTRKKVEDTLGVRTTTSNSEAAQDADVLVLAVKPQVAKGV